MVCPSCGTVSEKGAKFCKVCGKKLLALQIVPQIKPQNAPGQPPQDSGLQPGGQNLQPEISGIPGQPDFMKDKAGAEKAEEPKKKKKWLVPVIIAGALSILLLGGAAVLYYLFYGRSVPVSMNDYLIVTFEGYDGYGTAHAEIDAERLLADYQDQLRWKKRPGTDLKPAEVLVNSAFPETEAGDTLKNGEAVRITWNVPADFSELSNCEILAEDTAETVRGLTEVGSFDPFEGLDLRYEGFSSFGRIVSADTGGEAAETGLKLTDSWSEYENLENGDEVTLHLDFDESGKDSFVRTYGKLPSALEKKLTVEGLKELEAFDPFEGVTLVFEGEDGSGTLTSIDTENVSDICRDFTYAADRTENLKNGETVTVSFNADEERLSVLAKEYGKVPSAPEKAFTVSGLPGYYKSLSDIPADELERYTGEAIDFFRELYTSAKMTEKGYFLQDISCIGYTLTVRDGEDAKYDNLLYTFLQMTMKTDVSGEQVVYIPIFTKNVNYDKEGKVSLAFGEENAWYGTNGYVIIYGWDNTYIRVRGTRDFNLLPGLVLPESNTDNTGMKEAGTTLDAG